MTLAQLLNFVRIAELQSLSKAAAVIRIAQPALSRQVRHLEEELGTSLLIRHAWGVSLTAAGEVLLERARLLLREAEAARDAVLALAAEPSGHVALGVPSSVATTLLPTLARELRSAYPKLRLRFVDGSSATLHARALAGELDLAILYQDRAMGPLSTEPLIAERLLLIGPPDRHVAPGKTATMLRDRLLILPARPNRLRLIVDEVLTDRDGRDVSIEVDSFAAIVTMVKTGIGFTVLPYSTVAAEVMSGALAAWELNSPELTRSLLLVRPVDRKMTAAVGVVEHCIRVLVKQLEATVRWQSLTSGEA
jgi:LysR family nitrogen assimilation transcriptional regulator